MAFFSYLRNITYYLMFAAVVGIIAPGGKYKKFVSLVMGFILLSIMVAPLARFAVETIELPHLNIGEAPQMPHGHHLNDAFHAQLNAQLTSFLQQNNFEVHRTSVSFSDDFTTITRVQAEVSPGTYQVAQQVPFIRIVPVEITRSQGEAPCPTTLEVKNLISQFYNIELGHIYVTVR